MSVEAYGVVAEVRAGYEGTVVSGEDLDVFLVP